MTDRKKVIKALEYCKDNQHVNDCNTCDYGGKTGTFCIRMIDDILALLKEHEAGEQCLKTKCVICPHCDNCDVDENGLLKEQETIVRCKDCKHGEECVKPYKDYWCHLHDIYQYGDWFCADGERKDDNA